MILNMHEQRDGKNGNRGPRTRCGVIVKPAQDRDQGVWEFKVSTKHQDGKQRPDITKKVKIKLG